MNMPLVAMTSHFTVRDDLKIRKATSLTIGVVFAIFAGISDRRVTYVLS
jgi:hypothetical protein